MDHLSLETLARLLAGDLSHEDLLAQVVPHFLELCPVCRERYEEILRLQKELGHWDERVAVLEGREAPELLARLRKHSFDDQVRLVTNDDAFHTWGLAQLLLKESREAASADPAKATDLAELAVKVSQNLGEAYDPHWVLDLRARAYAHLGRARRLLGEPRSGETAFREAEALLAKSMTGNPEIQAEVRALQAGAEEFGP
ncbi:MAG TPA: hypothetical protein VGX68_03155 [Thermoanaerobaculia bacterium]|nr:hypothetical protein [Thermoanaerobaculia bacterium]